MGITLFAFFFVSEDGNMTAVISETEILVNFSLTMRKLAERVLYRAFHVTLGPTLKRAGYKLQKHIHLSH